ncbi:hypothetical protein DFQ14_104244 [Halopolyspora algeriensis]|uniref:VOC domain-containing protein n=1 Tax=Halopolyspora algeriensis TaxID=1500506 RepID=A0A368VSK9_9ACTN|nr:VOC family protein [Halopolyspora algeriensis]RCW44655.1 hypothetical protein DFQ14_104244 [Halopolyspora algeriensis]TQM56016.1 hypothetical protein FHU43_0794 [Halopolyspora algeriensis]
MRQHVDIITLGVPELDAARRFYVDGLGWEPLLDAPGEVLFFQVGHGLALGLYTELAADVGGGNFGAPSAAPVTLACNVDTEGEVVELLDRAVAAGGTVVKPAQQAEFGGFHGYLADPFGFHWEIAYNPGWSVDDDGRVRISSVEDPDEDGAR